MKLHTLIAALIISVPLAGILGGCTTLNPYTGEEQVSRTTVGTGVGAVGGALVGQLVGGNTTSTLVGAGLGAAVGGVSGNYMDRQNAELRAQLQDSGVQVIRQGREIRLIMSGDITFKNNSADIRPSFYRVLNSVALVLRKFNATTVKISGFASSVGAPMYNQELSEQRARAVASYLIAQQVDPNRLLVVGYGARYPIASNATPEGQAQNRRVEIGIQPLR